MEREQPIFSIIIPTRNRPEPLAACLESIARLDYPCDHFEVIVVDDGSNVSPETVVARFRDRLDVKLVTQAHAGPATARNTGAIRATGTFLAFTDDDCVPARDWLQVLAARCAALNNFIIGGRTVNGLPDNLYSTASQTLIDYLYSYYNRDPNKGVFFTSNNFAINAAHFRAIGGFDVSFPRAGGEDREFCERWLHTGGSLIYAAQAQVYHYHSMTMHSFLRQHFTYGQGAAQYHRIHARRSVEHIKLEPLGFYWNLIGYPLSEVQGKRSWIIAGLLVVTQMANAAGFYWENISNRQRHSRTKRRATFSG